MMLEFSKMVNQKKVKKTDTTPRTIINSSIKIACTVENTSKEAQEIRRLLMTGTPLYLCTTIKLGFWEVCQGGKWQTLPPWTIKLETR